MTCAPAHLFNTTVTVLRRTGAVDDSGGVTQTFATALTTPMRVQPVTNPDAVTAASLRGLNAYRCYAATGLDIRRTDRLQWTENTTGAAVTRTVEVTGLRDLQNSGRVLQLDAQEPAQ